MKLGALWPAPFQQDDSSAQRPTVLYQTPRSDSRGVTRGNCCAREFCARDLLRAGNVARGAYLERETCH
jgi:hypothetical protein